MKTIGPVYFDHLKKKCFQNDHVRVGGERVQKKKKKRRSLFLNVAADHYLFWWSALSIYPKVSSLISDCPEEGTAAVAKSNFGLHLLFYRGTALAYGRMCVTWSD